MTALTRRRLALTSTVTLAVAVMISACAPTAQPEGTSGTGTSTASAAAGSASCPPTNGYETFTSDLITAAPPEGAIYGDGSPLSFTLAMGEGYTPSLYLAYINDAGVAVALGAQNLLDMGGGVYSNNLNVFDSDANGRPGFASVVVIQDGSFTAPAGQETASQPIIGVYCITFKVE